MSATKNESKPGNLSSFVAAFIDSFAEMPHRGTGSSFEPRAARILAELSRDLLSARVDVQPFAVDLSSGAWNVALHGVLLLGGLAIFFVVGILARLAWGPGDGALPLAFLGPMPLPALVGSALLVLLLLGSRVAAGRFGWSILSFFVPNADSANVIVSNLPEDRELGLKGSDRRLLATELWKRRFTASGADRLVILAAHYDTARAFDPRDSGNSSAFLKWALKGGIGLLPTLAYLALLGLFLFSIFGGLGETLPFGLGGVWWGIVSTLWLLIPLVVAGIEARISLHSANLPFNPGINDNLSGVTAVFATLAGLMPAKRPASFRLDEGLPSSLLGEAELGKTLVMAVFTGSEENGLRGSLSFAREVLEPAYEIFEADGKRGVYLVNLDSVSGGRLIAASGERNFVGLLRSGDPAFLESARPYLERKREAPPLVPPRASWPPERREYSFTVEPGPKGALKACTDLTGFTLDKLNGHIKAFTLVTRSGDPELGQPRDYHSLSDGVETLYLDDEPGNFETIVATAEAVGELVGDLVRGKL